MCNDIQEIEQLLYRACHAVDKGQLGKFVDLFHPNGVFIITWEENGKHKGHAEIRKWIENYNNTLRSTLKYLRHKITCPIIDVHENIATAYSYLDVEAAPKGNSKIAITVGHYDDKFIKTDGHWKFSEKKVFMDNLYLI